MQHADITSYLPGHVHAFYLMFVYYDRKSGRGRVDGGAPGIYSERINTGGAGYGTL